MTQIPMLDWKLYSLGAQSLPFNEVKSQENILHQTEEHKLLLGLP